MTTMKLTIESFSQSLMALARSDLPTEIATRVTSLGESGTGLGPAPLMTVLGGRVHG